ncbi:unnamed protein product [Cuscuta campestris]|uniref:Uncharacterized protein n=1 Tax=Cuscuta campestris TaxID=132261 RepID=A0A484N836_9ASTE|nr:unnamed protein product [Cuscuta campestris]
MSTRLNHVDFFSLLAWKIHNFHKHSQSLLCCRPSHCWNPKYPCRRDFFRWDYSSEYGSDAHPSVPEDCNDCKIEVYPPKKQWRREPESQSDAEAVSPK